MKITLILEKRHFHGRPHEKDQLEIFYYVDRLQFGLFGMWSNMEMPCTQITYRSDHFHEFSQSFLLTGCQSLRLSLLKIFYHTDWTSLQDLVLINPAPLRCIFRTFQRNELSVEPCHPPFFCRIQIQEKVVEFSNSWVPAWLLNPLLYNGCLWSRIN